MSKQILYCGTSGTVIDWQDLDQFAYAAPAPGMKVLPVTAEQWKHKDALHYVLDGELARVDVPPPSAAHHWDGSQWALDSRKPRQPQRSNRVGEWIQRLMRPGR
ncbi:hypothetical protein ACQKQA_21320 [Pseudomonas sp. NPDC089530]|uniref:hypothetical protein n=1 Tax=Pseudomonas sp. NPDC089530 TaxID=3390651 RepID=UPI003D02A371